VADVSTSGAPGPSGGGPAGAPPPRRVPDLVVHGLRKTYGVPPVRALRGVDLTVRAGEFVALMGPSGSGKSTLLHLIAGLDRADEGTVALAGVRTEELGSARLARLRRRHVGLVFQFFHLIDHLSALENVALAALIAGARPAAAATRARDLLDMLGLLHRAAERPGALSGGERQRVAIARALANRPTLLLADEPTGALDSAGAADVLDLFARLHRTGQSILMVTHSREVADGAQRIVRMRDGVVVDEGAGPPRPAVPHRGDLTVPVPLRVDALTGRPDRAPGRQP
jgi:putative ABC transport system ATP-binding protein